ncbi:helix-turn-helix transcriptional regulator [Frigoribacterium sp. CFBP 8754]|uniref:helix-turn-helix domain-containing protein n=1 Tax=Frigoribacterium sp. CFBP 8754 TaxID=2775290 RepID=UPI001784268B|nr:helix-turn-helix transcriptional regulator [Frigoribacterium sp. CFBP 8754]
MATQTVGALLRGLRESKGESLRHTASNVGVAASQLSRMERGQRSVGGAAERLADYYSVPVESFLPPALPSDIVEILQQNPQEMERLRAEYSK